MKQKFISKCLTLILLCCFFENVNAQETQKEKTSLNENSFTIGLTGGISMPMGNYTKTDYYDPKSGFAGAGYNMGISGTWMLNKNFGLTALVSIHSFNFNGLQTIADSFHAAYAIDSATVLTLGGNQTVNILVGPYYSLPVNRKLSIDFRLLAGVVNAQMAGYQFFVESQAASTFSQKISYRTAFGAQLGVACNYNIYKQFYIMLNLDYFYSQPNFKIEYDNRNNNAGRYLTSYNELITGLNTNLTLAYRFVNK